ncbi:hypothetical protein ABH942_001346 [Flavobacterium sp. 28YEA47A]|uniref:hypothetical protein n=1 Tax=Flavobacterium sp. 28YEA47A TaxID=3156276 RepID=UPI003515BEF0
MKNYTLGLLLFLSAVCYSQNKNEKGTYISNSLGQDVKLNLLDNNKYELVLLYGDYEVKNDTLFFNNNYSRESDFAVAFSYDANPGAGKIRVNIKGTSGYFSGIYIGTQSGKSEPDYKAVYDLTGELGLDETEANFEINRAEYLYLAREDYNGETTLYKYALPRSANEIKIEYTPNYLGKMDLQGYYNEKNELVISENKKNPLTFVRENQKSKVVDVKENPIETTKKKNWTYPGKTDMFGYGVADSAAVAPASDFKLVVHDNMQKALEATKKTPQKYLVVSYDPDNKSAKNFFDVFIQNQEYNIGSYSSYGQIADYDKYNYYLATAKDESWATKNVMFKSATIVMDGDGNILSQTERNLSENAGMFDVYYSSIGERLQYVKAMVDLNKALSSKKTKDSEIVKKLLPLSDDNLYSWSIEPPVKVAVSLAESSMVEQVEADTIQEYPNYENQTAYTKVNFDKKKLLSVWDRIVNSHAKDKTPDMDFVKIALAEVQNRGFYYKIYNEGRPFDEANFKAIDYLLKHYDAILEEQKKTSEQGDTAYGDYIPTIESQLPLAISSGISQIGENTDERYRNRIMDIYKKVMAKKPQDYTTNIEYLRILQGIAEAQDKENPFVAEYDVFFKEAFKGGKNEIEILDDLYTAQIKTDYSYNDWTSFKNSFSNASNEAAWFVVQKGKDPESIKKAIQWSESSLRIEKNSPYYLDTLAQLYYKNGEKQKAIKTQEQALKFSDITGEESKAEMEAVLEKMKNGTY